MKFEKIASSLVGLFPRSIEVKYINVESGLILKSEKRRANEFEDANTKPMILHINGQNWRVVDIVNKHSDKFKLEIHLVNEEKQFQYLQGSLVPTYASLPDDISDATPQNGEIKLILEPNEWRQLEFLPHHLMEFVCNELDKISDIINDKERNPLLGYRSSYLRTLEVNLALPKEKIFKELNTRNITAVVINGHGVLKDCIAIETEVYTYYAIHSTTEVTGLWLKSFDYLDDQMLRLLEQHNLILVDWCNALIIN